ncbi:response regulator [Scytonema sp. NUACC26]|uniref:response regulator n=1 Tax=Scytonema sp. NUACC26 TaxID=3140176 RepID=UPI0034DBD300
MQSNERRRILVVDDCTLTLQLYQTALSAEGYDVDTATNGCLALAKIEASPPDLVLLDIMMPKMSGIEVTQRIRQNNTLPFICILLVSGCSEANVQKGLELGANDFVRKPIKLDGLLAKISGCFR